MSKKFMTVKVGGLKELEKALHALDHDLHKKVLKASGKAAMEPVLKRVKENVTISTGGLHSTARISATTDLRRLRKLTGKAAMITSVSVGRGSRKKGLTGHQALNLEYGTNKMSAKPFMRPAIQGKEKTVFMHFRKHLKKGVLKSARTQNRRNIRLREI